MSKKHLKSPFGVVVQTWGTTADTSASGMLYYYDKDLFGGNVGHAALELRLPLGQMELVKQYCDKSSNDRSAIPYVVTKCAETSEEYIAVRFSWWPGDEMQYYLESSLMDDRINERDGHDVSKYTMSNNIELEEVYVKGQLGERKIKLAPIGLSDVVDEPEIEEYLRLHTEKQKFSTDIAGIKFLKNKYDSSLVADNQIINVSKASMSYIKNLLGTDLPDDLVKKSGFTKEDCVVVYERATEKLKKIKILYNNTKIAINLKQEQLCKIDYVASKLENIDTHIEKLSRIVNESVFYSFGRRILTGYSEAMAMQEIEDLQAQKQDEIRYLELQERRLQIIERALLSKKQQYLKLGKIEDSSIDLPIGDEGMNIEAMLKEMRSIADNESFHLKYMNCSVAAARILAAGAPYQGLKNIAAQRAWGFFANPQKVYNAAVILREALLTKYSLYNRIKYSDFLGINSLVGFVINTYVIAMQKDEVEHAKQGISAGKSHKKITWNKVSALLKSLPIVPIVAVLYIVKHLLQPSLLIKDSLSLLKWAFENKSKLLKLLFTIVLIPVIIIHLIPAIVENIIFGILGFLHIIVSGVINLFKTESTVQYLDESIETESIARVFSELAPEDNLFLVEESNNSSDVASTVDAGEEDDLSGIKMENEEVSNTEIVLKSEYVKLTSASLLQYQSNMQDVKTSSDAGIINYLDATILANATGFEDIQVLEDRTLSSWSKWIVSKLF
jgi:hypothetical protein